MASFIEIHLKVTELCEKSYYFWIAPRICMTFVYFIITKSWLWLSNYTCIASVHNHGLMNPFHLVVNEENHPILGVGGMWCVSIRIILLSGFLLKLYKYGDILVIAF